MQSPVPDVALDDPDFDSALGCVEHELMELKDGIHFNPQKLITALEMNAALKKLSEQIY